MKKNLKTKKMRKRDIEDYNEIANVEHKQIEKKSHQQESNKCCKA